MQTIGSTRYAVTVNGAEKNVLRAPVKNAYFYDGKRRFDITEAAACLFSHDFSAPAQICVRPNFPAKSVRIRPEVDFAFENGEVRFALAQPAKLSLEFDGDLFGNLHLFAEKQTDFAPQGDVVRFAAGEHFAGTICLKSGQTLCLEEGAFVRGVVKAEGDNIRVCGFGVLAGCDFEHDDEKPREMLFRAENCKNLRIEGVFMLDSPSWTLCCIGCENVLIRNVKQICHARNSDGLDICACRDVRIEDCFLRNYDDNISVKACAGADAGDCRDISMKNCLLWGDCAHNMLIGPESDPEAGNVYENIVFENIRVLEHKEYLELYQGVMAVFAADNARIQNILWKNISIDRIACGRPFSFTFTEAYASTVGKSIRNVTLQNITCGEPCCGCSVALGFSPDRRIEGVKVENITIAGTRVTADSAAVLTNEFAEIEII